MTEVPTKKSYCLISNIGRLGDTIVRNSILNSVRQKYDHVTYIGGRSTAPIIESDNRIDRTVVFENSVLGFKRLLGAVLPRSYDCLIDLKDHDSRISLIIASICRAKLKVGCNRKFFRPFHRDTTHTHGAMKNKSDVIRDIAEIAGLDFGEFQLKLQCSSDSLRWFETIGANLGSRVFVNISATADTRIWSTENWVKLLGDPYFRNTRFLINGLPSHAESVQTIVEQIANAATYQPRHVMDVIAGIEASKAMLTVDTGVVPAAAGLNVPSFVLYASKEQAFDFAPPVEGNIYLSPPVNNHINSITPESVIEKIRDSSLAPIFE